MKIVGLIAEYNPFHNGHRYHIEKALEMTNADAAVVLMSGNFVQRGAPALLPKHLRAEAALKSGASVVMELPVLCACGSAEYFARGAISLFDSLGCVDSICFGSECGDLASLKAIAQILAEEPEGFRLSLQAHLKQGDSFPLARQKALAEHTASPALAQILEQPNNILGVEYLKAIYRAKSPLCAHALRRVESGYHDLALSAAYSSASAIRRVLSPDGGAPRDAQEALAPLEDQVPASCMRLLRHAYHVRYPICADDFSLLLKYRLLSETADSLNRYADVTPELANRIIRCRNSLIGWDAFCDLLKTREVTFGRISRILLYILLGITKEDLACCREAGCARYARLLGFSRADTAVLREIKAQARIPLITKLGRAPVLDAFGLRMLELDIFAANLYESVVTEKYKYPFIHECEQQVRIV